MDSVNQLAQHLVDAHAQQQHFQTLQLDGRSLSVLQAYQVQDHFVDLLCAGSGDTVIGYKIGLTSQVMQRMCGIDSPIHGRILASRVHASGCALQPGDYGRLGLEFEIAVKIGRDMDHVPATFEEIGRYVEAICPAIELVDDRAAEYQGLDAASLIADNSWNAGIVLGRWTPAPSDLAARTGRLRIDGALADEGRVGDALEHPFMPVHWLASELAKQGRRLTAGTIVMTGSIVKTRFPTQAGHWQYAVDGFEPIDLQLLAGAA